MKRYEIKVYDKSNLIVPKKTITFISGNEEAIKLKNDFTFDGIANGGQGALRLEFNVPFNDSTYALSDIVRVRGYDDNNKTGRTIYSGYIENIERTIDGDGQSIEVSMFGLASLMNTILPIATPSGFFSATNLDPSTIITNLLNAFNLNFPSPVITFAPIPLYGSLITIAEKGKSVLEILKVIHSITGWIFYVDGDGVFTTQPRGTIPDHRFTVRKDINVIKRSTAREDIITRLFLEVDNQLVPAPFIVPNTYQYDNLPAQAIYGLIDTFISRQSWITTTGLPTSTMDEFAANFFATHDKPKNFIRLELNDTADFLTIKPGDLIRIKNLDFTLEDAVINKISYSSTSLSIDCEKTIDFGLEIVNRT